MLTKYNLRSGALMASLALGASTAFAQITYVDANAGNTTLAAGGAFPTTAAASGTDGIWRTRTFGNSASIFEAGGDNSTAGSAAGGNNENVPRLVTTITGLTPGVGYDLYAYFWDTTAASQNWRIRAATSDLVGDLSLFDQDTGPLVVPGDFVVAPLAVESDRSLRQAAVGVATADGSGSLRVYIDDDPAARAGLASAWAFRTWYDGVGYAQVPEPTVMALAGLGLAGLLVWRRRHC